MSGEKQELGTSQGEIRGTGIIRGPDGRVKQQFEFSGAISAEQREQLQKEGFINGSDTDDRSA